MKSRSLAMLVTLAAVMMSAAFPAPRKMQNTTAIQLQELTVLDCLVLQPGKYTVHWSGTGPTVQVSFLRKGRTVATIPATLEHGENGNGIVLHAQESDAPLLVAIEMKNSALRFADDRSSGRYESYRFANVHVEENLPSQDRKGE